VKGKQAAAWFWSHLTPNAACALSWAFQPNWTTRPHCILNDITKSKIYYMEGYLAASPTGLNAAFQGRKIAKEAGVAL
jgi:hypothetical protein